MIIIPDCTLTTACFCLHDKNKYYLSVEKIIENIETLMMVPVYLVINCDSTTYPVIKNIRDNLNFGHITKYNVIELHDLWTYQYEDQVNKNRETFWETIDPRTGTDSHLIAFNKFDFVLKTIDENPFQTSKFGWIDCFIRKNAEKISKNYSPNMIPYILSNITDKFHIQILNVTDKKYKLPENKKEFYQKHRYIVCGNFFTCGKDSGTKILNRLKEIFIETTNAGFGHGDEMLYLEILDEFYDDIVRSYGDYKQILNNFIEPTMNYYYIYYFIFKKYYDIGYQRECYDCGKVLLNQIKSYKVNINVSACIHFDLAFQFYVTTFYYKHEESSSAAQYIIDICKMFPKIKNEWNKFPSFYREQLQHVVEIPADF
jgi:hypothetical protein